MLQQTFKPTVADLIKVNTLPDNLGFLNETLSNLLKKLFYENLQSFKSLNGDEIFYNIDIISHKRINLLEIPGSGIAFILNPPNTIGIQNTSVFNVSFEFSWEILRFRNSFNLQGFTFDISAFFNLIAGVFDITEKDFLEETINVFIGDINDPPQGLDPLQDFVTTYNSSQANQLSYTIGDTLNDIYNQLVSFNEDIPAYLLNSYLDNGFNKFKRLISRWIGPLDEERLKDLIIPQFSAALNNVSFGIEFPRKVFIPLDASGNELPEPAKSMIIVEAGSFRYGTRHGFNFDKNLVFDFPKSAIGKTGLTIEVDDLKIDFSRSRNIPEAADDGRPTDFIGVYIREAIIGLPEKWFKQESGATLAIVTRNALIGTGGMSGTIGLEVVGGGTPSNGEELVFEFGKGFKIGFHHFHTVFQQNALIESSVKGSLTIPKFKQCGETTPLRIDLEVFFESDGDFKMTADIPDGLKICFGDIFDITLESLSVGKDDNKAFLCITGDLVFSNNNLLGDIFKEPFSVENFCIYSDGSFELEGGSLPLPDSIEIALGPVKLAVSNIHFGSHEQKDDNGNERKYKFFGLDAGVSINPGGVDARGNGMKYYFTVDDDDLSLPAHRFFRIEGIGIDLVIPGNVEKKEAALLLQGYLAIKEDFYQGSLSFQLPKAKIAGGAAMAYYTNYPAWVVDAFLELSTPILLGNTGLGIFGFRGLFGLRYLSLKSAAGLTEDATWFDYYVAPEKGINIDKMSKPDGTVGAKNPFSIGAGASLATATDNGKAFSSQLLLLISLPKVIFLEGKANVLGERVGLTDEAPPFFAFLSIAPGDSIEVGMGADYKLQEDGKLLSIQAEIQAAFFFKNPSAWYVYFGTEDKPIEAQIFSFIQAYSYLMLDAKGIQAGAGADLGFSKKYGPVSVSVSIYFDVWGKISFERPQIGAGANVGGHVEAKLFGIGFFISIATSLSVEVPKPFRIYGFVELCVGVKIIFKKIEKCFTVKFEWEKNKIVDKTQILPLPTAALGAGQQKLPVNGIHIPTKKSYRINYFGARSSKPNPSEIDAPVPLDMYIDFQSEKNLDPSAVTDVLGGATHVSTKHSELIPPNAGSGQRQVKHFYKIHKMELFIADGNSWKEYHPYEALAVPDALTQWPADPTELKIGYWQKSDRGFNKFRLLSQTPFNYMEPVGDYIPEQAGLTATTLYCVEKEREKKCVQFPRDTLYEPGVFHFHNQLLFKVFKHNAQVVSFNNTFQILDSLKIEVGDRIEFFLPEPSVCAELRLFSFAQSVEVSYFKNSEPEFLGEDEEGNTLYQQNSEYVLIETRTLEALELINPVIYYDEYQPIVKIVIEPEIGNESLIRQCQIEIEALKRNLYEGSETKGIPFESQIALKEAIIKEELEKGCFNSLEKIKEQLSQELENCQAQLLESKGEEEELIEEVERLCRLEEVLHEAVQFEIRPMKIRKFGNEQLRKIKKLEQLEIDNSERSQDLFSEIEHLNIELTAFSNIFSNQLEQVLEKAKKKLFDIRTACRIARASLTTKKEQIDLLEAKISRLEETIQRLPKPVAFEGKSFCGTYIHEVCWLTESDHMYNESIPGQDVIAADYSAMQSAIEQTISPIWRPNSKFLVHVELSDTVKFDGENEVKKNYYFGFQTLGPLGHFPATDIQPSVDASDPFLEEPETSLKFYIDFQKSYPNANGEILYAKPLYFENPKLLLFYNRPYVWHFFNEWPDYQGLDNLEGALEIIIKDPTEDISQTDDAQSDPVIEQLPETTITWETDPDPAIPEDIQIINNLVHPELTDPEYLGMNCWQVGGTPIIPTSLGTGVEIEHLLPKKLYTAVVNNHFENQKKEVHRYVFQTSCYPNFQTHIESYKLKGSDGSEKQALFTITVSLTPTKVGQVYEIVTKNHNPTYDPKLESTYTDFFQRLTEGFLEISSLAPPVSTEFNLIYNDASNKIIAIWIRSIEPFNDPKIPLAELETSIEIAEDGIWSTKYNVLFSRDRSQIILMNEDGEIDANQLKIRFDYLTWNGSHYDKESVETENLEIA